MCVQAAAVEVVIHLHRGDITAATDSFNSAATYVNRSI